MVEEAFTLIGSGEVTGVFQLEGQGMRGMLVKMKPTTFEQIIAAISLYRPGPMQFIDSYIARMHGEEQTKYVHPKLASILDETYGIVVYQEQIQRIGADLFGYSLGDADLMRRAVSKKKAKDLAKHKEIFIEKGPEHGVSAEVAGQIFDQVEFFAAYGFNKSHAADYAVITCQTAFLKRHYPSEYYTALLSVQRDNIDDVALFTADCRRLGIPILGPNINASELDFTIEPSADGKRSIRFGLGAIKGVGDKAVEMIVSERRADGPFTSLSDFARRVDLQLLGGRALDAMTKVGVFNDFAERDRLLAVLPALVQSSKQYRHDQKTGQTSLFNAEESSSPLPAADAELLLGAGNAQPVTVRQRLTWEKELIGLYVSDHPLAGLMDVVQQLPNLTYSRDIKEEAEEVHDRLVTLVGLAAGIRPINTKKGETMAVVTVEDMYGTLEAVFFPRTWARFGSDIEQDKAYIFRGHADTKRGTPQMIVDSISQEFEKVDSADGDEAQLPPPSSYQNYNYADYSSPQNGQSGQNGHGYNSNGNGNSVQNKSGIAGASEINGNGKNAHNGYSVSHSANESAVSVAVSTAVVTSTAPSAGRSELSELEQKVPAPNEPPPDEVWDEDEETPQRRVRKVIIRFDACKDGNLNAWVRRVQRIHGELIQHPGQDVLVFRLPDSESDHPYLVQFKDRIDFDAVQSFLAQELKPTEQATWSYQN